MHAFKMFCAAGLVVVTAVSGCGQSRQPADTTSDKVTGAPVPPPVMDSAGTPRMAELLKAEMQLDQIVEQGRLNEVHDQAARIQASLEQVAGHATPEQKQQLTAHMAAAGRLSDELHDAADAGDLTKTKAKLQEFKTHLRAIEGVLGVTTR